MNMACKRGDEAVINLQHSLQQSMVSKIQEQRQRRDVSQEDSDFWDRVMEEENEKLNQLLVKLQEKQAELLQMQTALDALLLEGQE